MFSEDPFAPLDVEGVGEPIQVAAARGRTARPSLKLRICRDDWRDPVSVAHGRVWGLDGVSCSPYCGSIALLGAARSGRVPYRNLRLHRLIRPAPRRVSRAASGPVAVTNAQRRDEEVLRAAVRRRVAAGQLWEPYQEDVRMFAQEFFSFVRISNSFLTIVIWLQFWILPLDGSDGPRMEEIT